VLRADASSIVVRDRLTHTLWSVGVGSEGVAAHAYETWAAVNPLCPTTFAAPAGALLVDPVIASRQAYERSLEIARHSAQAGVCYPLTLISVAAVKILQDASSSGVVTVARGRFSALFGDQEVSILSHLAPHLQRAIQVNQRIARVEGDRAGLAEALERSPQGVLLLDANAAVLFAHHTAKTLIREGDGLKASADGLRAASPRDTSALRRHVREAANAQKIEDGSDSFLAIRRPPPRGPLSLLVTPLRGSREWLVPPAARAIVFVADPDALPTTSAEQLRRLYALTPAEAGSRSLHYAKPGSEAWPRAWASA
jgi:hypothetical protein